MGHLILTLLSNLPFDLFSLFVYSIIQPNLHYAGAVDIICQNFTSFVGSLLRITIRTFPEMKLYQTSSPELLEAWLAG